MTWTYSNSPSSSNRDAIRVLLGDTNSSDPLLTDEEIAFFLAQFPGNIYSAAAMGAQAIAAKYARLATEKEVGDLRIEYGLRHEHFLALSGTLADQSALTPSTPYLGGKSISDKEANYEDTDIVQPHFVRNQFDDDQTRVALPYDSEDT